MAHDKLPMGAVSVFSQLNNSCMSQHGAWIVVTLARFHVQNMGFIHAEPRIP